MFERSKIESLRDVSITRIDDTLSYGFPQTALVKIPFLRQASYSFFILHLLFKAKRALDNQCICISIEGSDDGNDAMYAPVYVSNKLSPVTEPPGLNLPRLQNFQI